MMAHYYGICPDLKYLLEYEPTEIDNILKCCGRPRLHHSLSEGLSKETLQLLNKGADVNIKDTSGQTALHVAVKNRSVCSSIVEMIAEKSSDINSKDKMGKAALHLAISFANYEAVKTLFQSGANPDIEDCDGNSPLHYALPDNLDVVETFVEHGAIVELKNNRGKAPLHKATEAVEIRRKDKIINTMRLLLDKGANINAQNCDGETPLHLSVLNYYKGDNHELCTFLLSNGAKVDLQDKKGYTPLHLAAIYNIQICTQMLETESGKTAINIPTFRGDYPLHIVAKEKDFNIVKLFLDNGAIIDSKNEDGETALHLVMEKRICNLLIKRGASLKVRDVNGMTPLHSAAENLNSEVLQLLLKNDAEVNSKNNNGVTPLHVAAAWQIIILVDGKGKRIGNFQKGICKTLLSNGALPNVLDDKGMSPLHYATKYSNLDIIELLIENGADVNVKSKSGKPPLHISVVRKSVIVETLNLLLQKGARVNEQDNNGQTALHNICYNKNKCCAKRNMTIFGKDSSKVLKLLEWGASQNIKDNFGKKPSDYCLYTRAQKEYDIKRTCLYSNCDVAKDVQKSSSVKRLQNGCKEEISRMKLELFGNHTLYDIFRHYDDPNFLSNIELELEVQSKELEDKFPLYCSMLTSTYRRSKERVWLFHSVSAILSTPLPFEVKWHILTYVDNYSLWNVIKAKKEFPIEGESGSMSKSETQSNSESDWELESESDWELNSSFESDLEDA